MLNKIRTIQVALVLWGMVCIASPLVVSFQYPFMKTPTPVALKLIGEKVELIEGLTEDNLKWIELSMGWITGNDSGLKRYADWSGKVLFFIAWGSAIASFIGAYQLRNFSGRSKREL